MAISAEKDELLLKRFDALIAQSGARRSWCLWGSAAVQAYGVQRTLGDIDLLFDASTFGAIVTWLQGTPHQKVAEDKVLMGGRFAEMEPRRAPVRIAGRDSVMLLDLVETKIARIAHQDVWGRTLPVLGLEDLIAVKLVLARGRQEGKRDLLDVEELVRLHAQDLDGDYLASILAQPGMSPGPRGRLQSIVRTVSIPLDDRA